MKSVSVVFKKKTHPSSEEATQREAKEIGGKLKKLSRSLKRDIKKHMEVYTKEKSIPEIMDAANFGIWNGVKEDSLLDLVKETKGYKQIHEICKQSNKKIELDFRFCSVYYNFNGNVHDTDTDSVMEKRLSVLIDPNKPYIESSDAGILEKKKTYVPKVSI
ncbi:MAG: hypothetical protein KAI76_01005 [Alphaproteobacteria bacterium]|nr:hypothetical protein [Alphaproteobacteria bacterium]